mmetsp:Transcript_30437/g.98336  ORF Transcript_30437/g.98336 Transcript_30437/m.98336 type:complete len:216 (+) Transcript_30437:860-1507(+)
MAVGGRLEVETMCGSDKVLGALPVDTLRSTAPATAAIDVLPSHGAARCRCAGGDGGAAGTALGAIITACGTPYALSALRLSRQSTMASVRKMVMPIGAATATKLRPIPRYTKDSPSRRSSRRAVARVDSSVLNISFRMTSSGLVSAAPATPAATLLIADKRSTCDRWPGSPGAAVGLGSRSCIASFTQMAVTYLGTVFITDAPVPCHNPAVPRVR